MNTFTILTTLILILFCVACSQKKKIEPVAEVEQELPVCLPLIIDHGEYLLIDEALYVEYWHKYQAKNATETKQVKLSYQKKTNDPFKGYVKVSKAEWDSILGKVNQSPVVEFIPNETINKF